MANKSHSLTPYLNLGSLLKNYPHTGCVFVHDLFYRFTFYRAQLFFSVCREAKGVL